ncbi:hypothetical protein BJX68DRAFT_178504 [Aspergillus pseudodeflectus]|uniref:Uncharacterized protein n=1 Tax=Aspergillus pseudodeflectus TaxID=176178 RepID=A0ABR4KZ33_9EURO
MGHRKLTRQFRGKIRKPQTKRTERWSGLTFAMPHYLYERSGQRYLPGIPERELSKRVPIRSFFRNADSRPHPAERSVFRLNPEVPLVIYCFLVVCRN